MTSKRKMSGTSTDSVRDSTDNDVVSCKKRKNNAVDIADSNSDIQNARHTSKYIRIMENEYKHSGNHPYEFVEKSGPQHQLPVGSKPMDYFNLFFTDSLWATMVEETNRYAEELKSATVPNSKSRLRDWYPVTVLEIKAFLAVLLEMGITRKPTIYSYWAVGSRAIPWFGRMFSRNRFQNILRCFHVVDSRKCFPPDHEKYDACAMFNSILEHANHVFKMHYKPHKMLSVEESLMGMPAQKQHKWGLRFWMLYDAASKYCISLYCHRGAKSKVSKYGLGYHIVEKLLDDADCLNKGHHVYLDNFFTTTALAKFLYTKNTYVTGAIRQNRKDVPNEARQVKAGETKHFQNGEVLLCAHREKRSSKNPVLLISTNASATNEGFVKKSSEREGEKTKSNVIHSYNCFKCGVDESDKMLYTYLDERRTLKYWKKVTFNIFSRMVLNSYLLYKDTVREQAMSRLQYTSDIISEIEEEWTGTRKNELIVKEKRPYGLEKLPGRNLRRCVVCSSKSSATKRSNLICAGCKKGLHPLCFHEHVCKFQ